MTIYFDVLVESVGGVCRAGSFARAQGERHAIAVVYSVRRSSLSRNTFTWILIIDSTSCRLSYILAAAIAPMDEPRYCTFPFSTWIGQIFPEL
jgi:hypothetical protein